MYSSGTEGLRGAMRSCLKPDKGSEDVDCIFFDADGDGTRTYLCAVGAMSFAEVRRR